MSRIKHATGLKLDSLELNKMQDLQLLNAWNLINLLIKSFGLIVTKSGPDSLGDEWKVEKASDTSIRINPGKAILKDGVPRPVSLLSSQIISIPGEDSTYQLVVKYAENSIEKGTVTVSNGSASITGSGTKFTEVFGPNRRIIIDDAAYTILTVNSDTSITLDSPFSGTSGSSKTYKVGGWFYGTPPFSVIDNLIYYYDDIQIGFKKKENMITGEYSLAEVVISSHVISSITDKRLDSMFSVCSNFADVTGTPSESFTVGGKYVQLVDDIPEVPGNIKITDIYADMLPHIDDSIKENIAGLFDETLSSTSSWKDTGRHSNSLNVRFKWGYHDIIGVGGFNSFTIDALSSNFSSIDLSGKHFYHPGIGSNLKILSNTGNLLSLRNLDNSDIDLSGKNINTDANQKGIINYNAEQYEIVAIPYTEGTGYHLGDAIHQVIRRISTNITPVECVLKLDIGTRYLVKVRSMNIVKSSDFAEIEAGSFKKYNVVQNYDKPFLVYHPQIPSNSSTDKFTLTSNRNGFSVDITGWEEAENFQITYTTKTSGPSFSDRTCRHEFTNSRHYEISTPVAAKYKVILRPLIAGLQVATPPPMQEITSGSGGMSAEDRGILTLPINHKTYSGTCTFTAIGEADATMEVTGTVSNPAGTSGTIDALPESIIGKICTIEGVDFRITSRDTSTKYRLRQISTGSATSGSHQFEIGTSEKAREIIVSDISRDTDLTFSSFDCKVLNNGEAEINIQQYGDDRYTDTIKVTRSDDQFSILNDVSVRRSNGAGSLKIKVSLYDSTNTRNNSELIGTLNIYGIPKTENAEIFE
ncbi:MAG: hypothetical protein ACM34K_21510 [Bacillota bacterium]